MISGNRDEAWPMYHVWPISERFMLGWSGGTRPACCHWLNTGKVDGSCLIMFVLVQSYPCDTWFFYSTLRELAMSSVGQLLFCLSSMWSRCCNAYRDLWIMTITTDCLLRLCSLASSADQAVILSWRHATKYLRYPGKFPSFIVYRNELGHYCRSTCVPLC